MARAIDKRIMLDLIIEAKKTDPEAGPFSEWLAEYLVDHLPPLTPPNEPERAGLYGKYTVHRNKDGSLVTDCFVLRPAKDRQRLLPSERMLPPPTMRSFPPTSSTGLEPSRTSR